MRRSFSLCLVVLAACSETRELPFDASAPDAACSDCDAQASAPDAEPDDAGVPLDADALDATQPDAAAVDAGDEGGPVVLSQAQVAFGTVPVGGSREVSITITNPNPYDLELTATYDGAVRRCDAPARGEPFCLEWPSAASPLLLGAGASVVVVARFSPLVPGTRALARVGLSGCAGRPACEAQLVLEGLAAGLDCGPAPFDVGGVAAGSCTTRELVCTNPAALPLDVAGWSLAATAPVGFSVEAPRAVSVGSEDSIAIELSYCGPSTPGVEQTSLQIELVAPGRPEISVPVRASSGPPDIVLHPTALDFGEIGAGAPTRRTIWVENRGGADLNITGMDPDVDGGGGFTVIGAPGPARLQVPAGERRAFTVEVMVGTGTVTNTLHVETNDPDTPVAAMSLRAVALPNHQYCSIQVVPYELSFGYVLRQTPAEAFLAVYSPNSGAPTCPVGGQHITLGSHPAFEVLEPVQASLQRGERRFARVRFLPTEPNPALHEGTLETFVRAPTRTTSLTGFAAEDGLVALPNALDFGVSQASCTNLTRRFLLVNASGAPSVLLDVQANLQWSAATITLGGVPPTPFTIPPGGHLQLSVTLDPGMLATTPVMARLEISTTTGWRTVALALDVQGDPHRVERFTQGPYDTGDLLIVASLGRADLERLRAALPRALATARGHGVDYHLGVLPAEVTGQPGALLPAGFAARDRVATEASLPSPEARVDTMSSWTRALGGQDEGLEQVLQAILPPASRTSNAALYRGAAPLGVIVVSDRDDASSRDVAVYTRALGGLKNDRREPPVSVSGLVGPAGAPCQSSTISADAAPRYRLAIESTGGLAESICEADWGEALERLTARALGIRDRFPLAQEPYVPSVEVYVDGVEVPEVGPFGGTNWRLDRQAVVFTASAVPAPGASVEVRYDVPCPSG